MTDPAAGAQVVGSAESRTETRFLTVARDRAGALAAVLAASHHDYPAFRAVFPHPRGRRRALHAFFAATIRDATRAGLVHAAVDRVPLGVAVWLPPGAYPWTTMRKLRAMPSLLRVLAAAPGSFQRFVRLGANADAVHPQGRHWYLEVLGVRPEAQGTGIGSRLLGHGLDRVDRAGGPAYVETSDPANVAFYRRFGFEVVEPRLELVPGGPPHVALRRPARTS